MVSATDLRVHANEIIDEFGESCLVASFTSTYSGASYDVEYLTPNGSSWVTCAHYPIAGVKGRNSAENRYLEEGRLETNDRVVFFKGTTIIDGNSKLGIGSPTPIQHKILDMGILDLTIGGTIVYRKAYARQLNNGSWVNQLTE